MCDELEKDLCDKNLFKLPFHVSNASFVRDSPLRPIKSVPITNVKFLHDPFFLTGTTIKVQHQYKAGTNAEQIVFFFTFWRKLSSMYLREKPSFCILRQTVWPKWKKENLTSLSCCVFFVVTNSSIKFHCNFFPKCYNAGKFWMGVLNLVVQQSVHQV